MQRNGSTVEGAPPSACRDGSPSSLNKSGNRQIEIERWVLIGWVEWRMASQAGRPVCTKPQRPVKPGMLGKSRVWCWVEAYNVSQKMSRSSSVGSSHALWALFRRFTELHFRYVLLSFKSQLKCHSSLSLNVTSLEKVLSPYSLI